jgi:hypothetical protein
LEVSSSFFWGLPLQHGGLGRVDAEQPFRIENHPEIWMSQVRWLPVQSLLVVVTALPQSSPTQEVDSDAIDETERPPPQYQDIEVLYTHPRVSMESTKNLHGLHEDSMETPCRVYEYSILHFLLVPNNLYGLCVESRGTVQNTEDSTRTP